ncbi:contact-dependent growth inhibition system immunity protein [Rhizobium sp. 18055]|uniref:contact-dependent growth inhibition system immunity protein n=1 Tax=Rhizobium sp. 18055 TaxID=2681403 RepID=UPI00135903EE|nr:contact-dependent growth inhibition system immunity protein [Rhizobium sp. 18055]
MAKNFENLEHLLGGYFHQDWDVEGANDAEVISAFQRTEPVKRIEVTIAEIDHILQLFTGDASKIEELLTAWGCEYYYQTDGLSGQEWLQRVRSLLMEPEL